MRFVLTGFTEVTGFRVFTFEGVAEDRTRTTFAVSTDLALTRRYDIRLQELPLLCRELLERCDEHEKKRAFTYTEAEMVLHANGCAAEREVHKRKNPYTKSHGKPVGVAWRTPPAQ
jgi:hypothetical protein